jgi:hypothetical protein
VVYFLVDKARTLAATFVKAADDEILPNGDRISLDYGTGGLEPNIGGVWAGDSGPEFD